jgi:hypothetical protein
MFSLFISYFICRNSIYLKSVQLASKFKREMTESLDYEIRSTIQLRRGTGERVQQNSEQIQKTYCI